MAATWISDDDLADNLAQNISSLKFPIMNVKSEHGLVCGATVLARQNNGWHTLVNFEASKAKIRLSVDLLTVDQC